MQYAARLAVHQHVFATRHPPRCIWLFKTRQTMYVYRNTEARSCYDFGNENAISITYSECVFVALGIQHAMRLRHIVSCGLSGSAVLFHIISQMARFSKKNVLEHKMCVLI